MAKFFLKASLIILVLSFNTQPANAHTACVDVHDTRPMLLQEAIRAQGSSILPAKIKEVLQRHSLAGFASRFKNKTAIKFNFEMGIGNYGGEGQQAKVLRSYLEYLFPQATFSSEWSDKRAKDFIEISIVDSSEIGHFDPQTEYKTIEMPLLKAGDLALPTLSKEEAKKALNLEGKSVVHLYVGVASKIGEEHFNVLIRELKKSMRIDALILSIASNYGLRNVNQTGLQRHFDRFVKLSTAKRTEIPSDRTILIYNDTRGLMSNLYAASDLAVVVGPINFFQPLSAGVRTLSIIPPDLQDGYFETTVQELATKAQRSGGFRQVRSWTSLSVEARKLQMQPAPENPALIEYDGSSPLLDVLNKLEAVIRSQIKWHYSLNEMSRF